MSHADPDESAGAFPEGWQLGADTWSFHRQFYARVGRPARHREYAAILWQIRFHEAERLDRYRHRVKLPDGGSLVVNGHWQRLMGVEPHDWTPRPAGAQPAPPSPEPVVEVPPTRPLRASTLTLGNPAAARVLAERLRRFGVPVQAINQASASGGTRK